MSEGSDFRPYFVVISGIEGVPCFESSRARAIETLDGVCHFSVVLQCLDAGDAIFQARNVALRMALDKAGAMKGRVELVVRIPELALPAGGIPFPAEGFEPTRLG